MNSTNSKLLLIVFVMLIGLTIATITNIAVNFREYGYRSAVEKSQMTAEIVRNGLTAHMVNGMMDKRDFFLSNVSSSKDVQSLWVVRSETVMRQYGEGFKKEHPRDAIDRQVLREGKTSQTIEENADNAILRITIPYIATTTDNPNCLSCHHAKEGDVLGAISMEFNINNIRQTGAFTILKILGINLTFIIIALLVTNYFFRPYVQFFDHLQQGIKQAYRGDFSFRFTTKLKHAGAEVAERVNVLFEKMENTFTNIRHDLATFISLSNYQATDPLTSTGLVIKELSDVYKFKKTIELDTTKEEIYERFIYLLKEKFHFHHFALYEINKITHERHLIYITQGRSFCLAQVDQNALECRAYRTSSDVLSTDFPNICTNCTNTHQYSCIVVTINSDLALLLSFSSNQKEEIEEMNLMIPTLKNYFESAKAVIESRLLMSKLRESSLRDSTTGLYNRRFLEEFIDKKIKKMKEKSHYGVLMIDIDYFKMINDNYGHDAGDVVIKALAQLLTHNITSNDIAIRYGGEEFLVLLADCEMAHVREWAERIRKLFSEKQFKFGSDSVYKSLSIGIAYFPKHSYSIWKVIKFADIALYEGKNSGRNRVVEFDYSMFH